MCVFFIVRKIEINDTVDKIVYILQHDNNIILRLIGIQKKKKNVYEIDMKECYDLT